MVIDIEKLNKLLKKNKWTTYRFSKILDLDYSFVHRVMKKQANPGSKFLTSIIRMCATYNLDINEYIFLSTPLSTNNDEGLKKTKTA